MSDEKKLVAQNVQIITEETVPDWAVGLEGIQLLLDGVLFQHSVNVHEASRMNEKLMKPLDPADFEGLKDQTKAFEILAGCVSAYFSAMALALPHQEFRKYISPLADVIGYAWQSGGVIEPLTKEETENMIKRLEEKRDQIEAMRKKASDWREEVRSESSKTDEDAIDKALKKLSNITKGLLS